MMLIFNFLTTKYSHTKIFSILGNVVQIREMCQVEERYTELVRGYLDFDVDMESVGVFWSGTEVQFFIIN